MKIAIIGAGKSRSGIGEYIGKYFHKHGGKVTSLLGTTEKKGLQASLALRRYGIEARPYTDFNEMVRAEKPDAVVIASPSSTHYEYLLKSLDSGLHIFCEKPFIWDDHMDILKRVEDIFKKASEKKLTVAMNSQWPFSIKYYEEICGKIEIKKTNQFSIYMFPFYSGREMIPESVPHALSLLYFSFGLNDKIVYRSLDLENYEIYFNDGNKKLRIVDPLELSIKNFMEAVEKKPNHLSGRVIFSITCLS